MSLWDSRDVITEDELLSRGLLAKCWIAYLSKHPVHFNEEEITVETATALLTEAGVDLTAFDEEVSDQGTELRLKHERQATLA